MPQFTFLPAHMVYANTLNIYPLQTYAAFCVLQARPHEIWARFLGSSMKNDLRYTPSDCFETYPFPVNWENAEAFEAAGREYYKHRGRLMTSSREGMTKVYNRFHDPHQDFDDIRQLRKLHAEMDRVVLGAYGWTDIATEWDFICSPGDSEYGAVTERPRYQCRWPEEVCQEVLARLLELNRVQAEAAASAG